MSVDDDDAAFEAEERAAIEAESEGMRAYLPKLLEVAPEMIDDDALEDLRHGPNDEAVMERWVSKPWRRAGPTLH